MKKEIQGYISTELHDNICADIHRQWKKSVDEIVAELKNRSADHVRIRRTIIYGDEKKELVSEWRKSNEGKLDDEGFLRDNVGKVRGEPLDNMGHTIE